MLHQGSCLPVALIVALHLDDAFHSPWFIAIAAFLCLNLLLCNIIRVPDNIRRMKNAGDPRHYFGKKGTVNAAVLWDAGEFFRKMHFPKPAEQDGKLLVLEEYIQGDSLDDLLRYSLLDARQTKDIALQLCEALWVLHRLGAVHRDVKPENILMRGSDAVLIDFDASRIQKADRRTDTTVLGTTGYAAPEQYGMSQTDARTDIYALGVVINVMLTGEHPSRRLAKGHMGRVVRRCTMMSPDQRYRDIPHLMEAL